MQYRRVLVLRSAAIAAAVVLGLCASAGATSWNERTILRFSSPVMIPGATLQPGTYVFKLARSQSDRDIVQVFTADQSHLITQTVTVPTKRQNPNGDIVLKFDPTEPGAAPALKAFFYPGSLYGHQFVYPADQAREIASRTKTVVLSADQSGTDMERGTLRLVDENGATHVWQPDTTIQEEWNNWRNTASAAVYRDHTTGAEPDNRAVAIQSTPRGQQVKIDDLEDHPDRYIGKMVTVDGQVQDVLGPQAFSMNGETMVVMPGDLAAMVRTNDRVSVTGVVKRLSQADFQRELTWFKPTRQVTLAVENKPVLVASRVVGGNDNRVLAIRIATPEKSAAADTMAVGTSGRAGMTPAPPASSPAMTSVAAINGTEDIGRRVDVDRVTVAAIARDGGFWVRGAGDSAVLVVPAARTHAEVKPGDTVSLDGVVLQMPRGRQETLAAPGRMLQNVYIYAFRIGA